jgi:hypothetical protein
MLTKSFPPTLLFILKDKAAQLRDDITTLGSGCSLTYFTISASSGQGQQQVEFIDPLKPRFTG